MPPTSYFLFAASHRECVLVESAGSHYPNQPNGEEREDL
jgi:hypothetical protein